MFNFKMTKAKQTELLNECNFNELERYIFNCLVEEKTRQEVHVLVNEKYGLSKPTVNRRIKRIVQKITNYETGGKFTHKIYMHIFPNGKKYVGVCQCCKDRWANGLGYAYNPEMFDAINKYGWENIEHKILIELSDSELAYKIEEILIEELDLINNGYNKLL